MKRRKLASRKCPIARKQRPVTTVPINAAETAVTKRGWPSRSMEPAITTIITTEGMGAPAIAPGKPLVSATTVPIMQ